MRTPISKSVHVTETEFARRMRKSNAARFFGFELKSAEPGRAVVLLRVRAKHLQVHGVVHGGILAALADTAAGVACYMLVSRGTRLATIEMKINYLEPVEKGIIAAEARVLRKGRTTAVAECDIRNSRGLLVAKALLTFSVGRKDKKG